MNQDLRGTPKEKAFYAAFGDPIHITADVLVDMFAKFYDPNTGKETKEYDPSDWITVTSKEYPGVKPTTTSIGIYICNKVVAEGLKVVGYINKVFDKSVLGALDKAVADALLAGDITQQQVFDYIDNSQWLFGGKIGHIINPSLSENILRCPPEAKALKKQLLEEHHKEVYEDNDPLVASEIELEVTSKALESLRKKDDPAMAIFDSNCGVDPNNNYKAMFIMKGGVKDNTGLYKSGYKIVTSEYDDGVTKEDQAKVADNIVTSNYASGVKTQDAGYDAKKYNAMYQAVALGPKGSDCKTTDTEDILITEKNAESWGQYHYHMVNGKPELLTPKNINNYIGKTLKMRVPDKCKMRNHKYCNICFGDLSYRLGITNIGLAMNIACGAMLNAALKTKHDSRVKPYVIDIDRDLMMFA